MKNASAGELKNRLGHYLQAVRRGKALVVTVRGQAIALLVPVEPQGQAALPRDVEERVWQLVAAGTLTWSGCPFQVPEAVATNRAAGCSAIWSWRTAVSRSRCLALWPARIRCGAPGVGPHLAGPTRPPGHPGHF